MLLTTVQKVAIALGAALIAAGAAGCSADASADGEEVTTLRYQSGPGLLNYAELADALGYLDGLTLKSVGEVQGGPAALQALATDQTDFAVGPFNGATAKVASTGVDVKAVAAAYGSTDEVNSSVLTLEDSGIDGGRDLIGKKVAVNTLGANAEAVLDTYLAKEGLSAAEIDKVTLVPLPGINAEPALRQGQVDAIYASFAAKVLALEHGGVKILANDTDFVGAYNGGSYVLKGRFIEDNPTTTKKLVAGITKAIAWDQAHTPEETLATYTNYLEANGKAPYVKALATWHGNGVATPGGVLRDSDFSIWIDWLQASGEVEAAGLKPAELYTNEFNATAEGE
jgi:ABC-type nitrate/sulfonate/bicarbonate transport system substrate-binding protein